MMVLDGDDKPRRPPWWRWWRGGQIRHCGDNISSISTVLPASSSQHFPAAARNCLNRNILFDLRSALGGGEEEEVAGDDESYAD